MQLGGVRTTAQPVTVEEANGVDDGHLSHLRPDPFYNQSERQPVMDLDVHRAITQSAQALEQVDKRLLRRAVFIRKVHWLRVRTQLDRLHDSRCPIEAGLAFMDHKPADAAEPKGFNDRL
jgi:hypothetical protein